MRVLYIAEIVGKPGIFAFKHSMAALKSEFRPDFVVGNGDGATGGFGMGKNHAYYLHKVGLQAITLGECAFYKKDLPPALDEMHFVVRPDNFPLGVPGRGHRIFRTAKERIAVVSLLGQSGYAKTHLSSPLAHLDQILEELKRETPHIIVDYHATTTAEKGTFFHWADGKVSAVIGSHSKIPTADAHITPGGTAVLTDAGRTGSRQSVAGFDPTMEIRRFLTGVPVRSQESWQDLWVQGVFIETDSTGRALQVQPFQHACKEVPHATTGNREEN